MELEARRNEEEVNAMGAKEAEYSGSVKLVEYITVDWE